MVSTERRKPGRRRNNTETGTFASVPALALLWLSLLGITSVVHGFTASSSSIGAIGKHLYHEFPAHIGQSKNRQRQPHVTNSFILASTKIADIDGSAVKASSLFMSNKKNVSTMSKLGATLSKIGMMTFIISMCLALPLALFPPYLLHRFNLISQVKQQNMALRAGQFCARWLLRLIPFCNVTCVSSPEEETDPQPCVWVCNHTSALDIFMLLAKDKELRGRRKRPIKIVYVSTMFCICVVFARKRN